MNRAALRHALSTALPPVLFFLAMAVLWHAATRLFAIPAFLLPSPLAILRAMLADAPDLARASALTAAAAASGFLCSLVFGCLVAFAFSQSALIRRCCYPYAIFLQTVPIVAVAPLIIIWFGTGFRSVVLVSFIVGLFPIISNATTGLTTIDRDLLDLFRLYRASRLQILTKLRLPAAVPYILAGARTASGLSVIGAIVGEFFAGYGARTHGLGYVIIVTSAQLKTADLFAAIACSTILGLLIFAAIGTAGAWILRRWYKQQLHGA